MGNKCFSEQQAREDRRRAVQESSLIAIRRSLNDSWPSLPIPGRPNYQHFRLTIEVFETFCRPGDGRRRGAFAHRSVPRPRGGQIRCRGSGSARRGQSCGSGVPVYPPPPPGQVWVRAGGGRSLSHNSFTRARPDMAVVQQQCQQCSELKFSKRALNLELMG